MKDIFKLLENFIVENAYHANSEFASMEINSKRIYVLYHTVDCTKIGIEYANTLFVIELVHIDKRYDFIKLFLYIEGKKVWTAIFDTSSSKGSFMLH